MHGRERGSTAGAPGAAAAAPRDADELVLLPAVLAPLPGGVLDTLLPGYELRPNRTPTKPRPARVVAEGEVGAGRPSLGGDTFAPAAGPAAAAAPGGVQALDGGLLPMRRALFGGPEAPAPAPASGPGGVRAAGEPLEAAAGAAALGSTRTIAACHLPPPCNSSQQPGSGLLSGSGAPAGAPAGTDSGRGDRPVAQQALGGRPRRGAQPVGPAGDTGRHTTTTTTTTAATTKVGDGDVPAASGGSSNPTDDIFKQLMQELMHANIAGLQVPVPALARGAASGIGACAPAGPKQPAGEGRAAAGHPAGSGPGPGPRPTSRPARRRRRPADSSDAEEEEEAAVAQQGREAPEGGAAEAARPAKRPKRGQRRAVDAAGRAGTPPPVSTASPAATAAAAPVAAPRSPGGPAAPLPGKRRLRALATSGPLYEQAVACALLPLPPTLERLQLLFEALNVLFGFMLGQQVQVRTAGAGCCTATAVGQATGLRAGLAGAGERRSSCFVVLGAARHFQGQVICALPIAALSHLRARPPQMTWANSRSAVEAHMARQAGHGSAGGGDGGQQPAPSYDELRLAAQLVPDVLVVRPPPAPTAATAAVGAGGGCLAADVAARGWHASVADRAPAAPPAGGSMERAASNDGAGTAVAGRGGEGASVIELADVGR